MRKVFKVQDLDCANCAAKMEDRIKTIDGVESASMRFMTQKLMIEVTDPDRLDEIMDKVQEICKSIEPDMVILR